MANVKDSELLWWLRDRLVMRYGEPHNVDFVLRLEGIARRMEQVETDSRPVKEGKQ